MRSSTLLSAAILLITSAAQSYSYDDFSDDFSLEARDQGYGYDLDDLLELYSREAELDLEADSFDFEARAEQHIGKGSNSIMAPDGASLNVQIKDDICIIDKKIESGSKCKGKPLVGLMTVAAKLPRGANIKASVSGTAA